MKTATLTTLLFASVAPLCLAHPHKRTAEEVVALKHATRSLKQCSSSLSKRGHNTAGVERRKAMADRIRKERGLKSGEDTGEYIQSESR